MVFLDDWRLQDPLDDLFQALLQKSTFVPTEKWDHTHCVFCWDPFFGVYLDGYCTLDGMQWICEVCFEDFREMFQWDLICK